MEKIEKKSSHGGARPGAGRPSGCTKIKLSVTVDGRVFERASRRWKKKTSPLIEMLLDRFASRGAS
jgi:hypothetical protein